MEQRIEDSLSAAVNQAVLQILRSLVGEKKAEVPALFHVTLVIEKNQRLELKPTVQVKYCFQELIFPYVSNSNFYAQSRNVNSALSM